MPFSGAGPLLMLFRLRVNNLVPMLVLDLLFFFMCALHPSKEGLWLSTVCYFYLICLSSLMYDWKNVAVIVMVCGSLTCAAAGEAVTAVPIEIDAASVMTERIMPFLPLGCRRCGRAPPTIIAAAFTPCSAAKHTNLAAC